MSEHRITINIGPQDSESWFCIACGFAAVAFFWMMAQGIQGTSSVERAKVEAHAKP